MALLLVLFILSLFLLARFTIIVITNVNVILVSSLLYLCVFLKVEGLLNSGRRYSGCFCPVLDDSRTSVRQNVRLFTLGVILGVGEDIPCTRVS